MRFHTICNIDFKLRVNCVLISSGNYTHVEIAIAKRMAAYRFYRDPLRNVDFYVQKQS